MMPMYLLLGLSVTIAIAAWYGVMYSDDRKVDVIVAVAFTVVSGLLWWLI